jgi:hypothetical protein
MQPSSISAYRDDVVERRYPSESESYHLPRSVNGTAESAAVGFSTSHLRRKA